MTYTVCESWFCVWQMFWKPFNCSQFKSTISIDLHIVRPKYKYQQFCLRFVFCFLFLFLFFFCKFDPFKCCFVKLWISIGKLVRQIMNYETVLIPQLLTCMWDQLLVHFIVSSICPCKPLFLQNCPILQS